MDEVKVNPTSEYTQASFIGGMNLLGDDSRLQSNQYRVGFDLTNRYDVLDPCLASIQDEALPSGILQEAISFGNYLLVFVSGYAYYRHYSMSGWKLVAGFKMSGSAPRFWTCLIPVATTNYYRVAATGQIVDGPDAIGNAEFISVVGAGNGNIPGLLVQDNISQPQFIFLDNKNIPVARTTQNFDQWKIIFTDNTNTVVAANGDQREYVPIGNAMTWDDETLYITSKDFSKIYRSVSGRPLDFMVNVKNTLATNSPYTQTGGGNADTTAYSVGVGGIVCLKALSTGGIFVSASGNNYLVQKNRSNNAIKQFGEYTFIRIFLFLSSCLSDRVILDSIGDTRFISLTGVRSFNAIQQFNNEGRNTPFTAQIQAIFGSENATILQSSEETAAIIFNDYELYAVNTIFGPAILKYDTINKCWASVDLQQADGKQIKQFIKIETDTLRLYAITTDNTLYRLYAGPGITTPSVRTIGVCANVIYENKIELSNPRIEIKPTKARAILNKITENGVITFAPYINNTLSAHGIDQKAYEYTNTLQNSSTDLPDVNTGLQNVLFSLPDCEQGWKMFGVFTWSSGSLTQFSFSMTNNTPMNPPNSQP